MTNESEILSKEAIVYLANVLEIKSMIDFVQNMIFCVKTFKGLSLLYRNEKLMRFVPEVLMTENK